MSQTVISDTDYATLWYHPEKKIIHHKFHRFIYGPEFRNVLDKGLEIMKQNGSQKWLSDDRENSTLTAEDGEWAQTDWSPRVIAVGWKFWAIVMPEKVIGQINMKRFAKDYSEKGVTVQFYTDADEALKWLESVD